MNELVNILSKLIFNSLAKELERQGHRMTGALVESFEAKIGSFTEDKITIDFLMLNYGLSLNNGIKPRNIPYTIGGPRRGGTSKFIEGLIKFAKQKLNVSPDKALGVAIAIATKQKREGYPLTGKIGFIDNVLEAEEKEILNLIELHFEAAIEMLFDEFLKNKM